VLPGSGIGLVVGIDIVLVATRLTPGAVAVLVVGAGIRLSGAGIRLSNGTGFEAGTGDGANVAFDVSVTVWTATSV
jgi:hypothetical protein